ncbi:MAG: glutamyl-tRNA reductase, partial [Acidobacteriaceae bacterium]
IMVANRTHERAVKLAEQFMGRAIRWEDLHARAHEADIIVTSTGSQEHILNVEQAQQILQKRKNRPVFVIDIAVPRDVDPQINKLEGIFLYDIDDLQQVAVSNLVDRGREAERAETIIVEETERFRKRIRTIDIAPAIVEAQGTAEELRQTELHRQQRLLQSMTPEQRAAVESMTRGLMNKFLHLPLQAMKSAAREGDAAALEAIRGMFHRDTPETKPDEPAQSETNDEK